MMAKLKGFLGGVIVTYIFAVPLVSYFNLVRISELGYPVSSDDLIDTILHDLVGMLQVYFPLIALALVVAWVITARLLTRIFNHSSFLYGLSGFIGVIMLHCVMYWLFHIDWIAATRQPLGLISQGVAGCLGSLVFYWLTFSKAASSRR